MPPSLPRASFASSASSSRAIPGALPSTLPSDPSEISATAQALLQTHYGRLKQGSASTSDSIGFRHSQVAKLEQAVRNLDRICLQLDNLQVTQQLHAGKQSAPLAARTLQPLGPLAFWPARLVLDHASVYVRQDPNGLSVQDQLMLEDEVLPMLTACPENGNRVSISVRLPDPSRTIEVCYVKMGYKDAQMQLQARKTSFRDSAAGLRDRIDQDLRMSGWTTSSSANTTKEVASEDVHLVNENNEVLNEEGLPFYEPVEEISEEEANRKKKAYMQPFIRDDAQLSQDQERRRRWLDDTLNKLEEEEQNEDSDDDEEVTQQTSAEPSSKAASSPAAVPTAEEETRVVLRTRTPSPPPSPENVAKSKALPEIVSAARPPPPKSALKASAASSSIVQRPSFGSAGIRHGFLNLNPSSPGAIKSSYSWEDLEREERKPDQPQSAESERSSRSHTPTPLSRNSSTVASSLLSRVTDSNSSPMTSGTSTPTKKSVRIKSPERAHPEASAGSGLTPLQRALRSSIRVKENYNEPVTPSQSSDAQSAMSRSLESGSGTAEKCHKDDVGVEEEAEKIVNLLGPDVVEGHPSAPPANILRKMQEAHEEDQRLSTPEAVAARAKQEEEQRAKERLQRLSEKPALGHSVMERPRSAATSSADKEKQVSMQVKAQAQQAKFSAFKQGFLNQKPTKFIPNTTVVRKTASDTGVPATPTQSLGMSALDRASIGDDELSKRRQAMGLSAAVPHARPSKAYAEKMKQKQDGLLPDSSKGADWVLRNDNEVKLARPVADDDVPRPGRVRFGPPVSSSKTAMEKDRNDEEVTEIDPGVALENHLPEEIDDGRELDEEQEEPKIEGEGADTDEEDAYFDEYLSKRSRRVAAADSRGLDVDHDGDDFDDEDEDDWDVDEDDFDEDEDDDFDYDPEDLMALAPTMGDAGDSLASHPDLLREYEEARAKLAGMGLAMPGNAGGGRGDELRARMMAAAGAVEEEEEDDYEMDVVPLDAAMDDPEYQGNTTSSGAGSGSRISRFKASLTQRKMDGHSSKSSNANLEDLLSAAQNLGPSKGKPSAAFGMDGMPGPSCTEGDDAGAPVMIIPQLAPVRFPKNGDLIEGKPSGPVELDGGESDEDDEKAEMVMRSRLERLEWKKNHPEEARRLAEEKKAKDLVEQGKAAPSIGTSKREKEKTKLAATDNASTSGEGGETKQAEAKPKKMSRFKAARMGQ